MKIIKEKKKALYKVATVYFMILFLMITVPSIVRIFDRNDVWVMGLPLSQFFIIIIPALATAGMAVLYNIEIRMEQRGRQ